MFKVGFAYVVSSWVVFQLTDVAIELYSLPLWLPRLVLLFLVIGFIPAMIMAWAYELTPEGVKLDEDVLRKRPRARKKGWILDYIIIVSLGLSIGYFIWETQYKQQTAEFESAVAAAKIEKQLADEQAANEPPSDVQQVEEAPPAILIPLEDIDENSIAVLPFANRSADVDDIYFTDGMHEDLLTQLSRIDALSVISRSSVMEYRDTLKNLKDIARELGVANIMEGSVQRAGDRVRINVQLIDAQTDEHLWADIYDRELTTDNLFDIQAEIARAIAKALEATLSPSELASVGNAPTQNVEAYDQYLKARRLAQAETLADYRSAINLYTESLQLDPGFINAWIGLARAHMTNYWVYGGNPKDVELALEAIEKAKAIDPGFPEMFLAEGFYWYWGHLDYERALYNLNRAIELMPGNDDAYMWRGWVSRRAGLWDQARLSMQEALKLNPRVHFNWHEYALTLMYLHRYEEARNAANRSRMLDPDSYWGKTTMAQIEMQAGGDVESAALLAEGAQDSSDYSFFRVYMQVSLAARQFENALAIVRDISSELEIQRNVIILKESWAAQILHYMGREQEAKQAASAALFRLKGMRSSLGNDYRLDLAIATARTIQGASAEEIRSLIDKSKASEPNDAVEAFRFKLDYAQVYGIAGMTPEATGLLESLLQPPSDTSVYEIDLDPAFDSIRNDPDFVAMMERHR